MIAAVRTSIPETTAKESVVMMMAAVRSEEYRTARRCLNGTRTAARENASTTASRRGQKAMMIPMRMRRARISGRGSMPGYESFEI